MTAQRNKVCGVDIHKKFLIATILTRDGTKLQKRFETDIDNLLIFRDWVIEENCDCVAIESTGVYWYSVHAVLENKVELILANAHQIKHTPGRKTDALDSEWIAEVALNNQIDPSRILPKEDRELRRLTRTRESLVKIRSQMKNQVHQGLESCSIKLSSVLSDSYQGILDRPALAATVCCPTRGATPFPLRSEHYRYVKPTAHPPPYA